MLHAARQLPSWLTFNVRQKMKIRARPVPPPSLMLFYAATMFILVTYIGSVAITGIARKEVRIPDRREARFAKREITPGTYWVCVAFYSATSLGLGGVAVRWTLKAISDLKQKRA
jgi:hypothetical protein